ncbi:MAG: hypothetical protein JSV34_00595 [Candidatus Omnitrophota bacterium]|nr:MAG: hypothetical protein JSV34_00595 [Candidatus Omnitrophota bacterium]
MGHGRKSFGMKKRKARNFIHFKKKKHPKKEKKAEEPLPRNIEIFKAIPEEKVIFRKKRK